MGSRKQPIRYWTSGGTLGRSGVRPRSTDGILGISTAFLGHAVALAPVVCHRLAVGTFVRNNYPKLSVRGMSPHEVLLGYKKRGFGAGTFAGIGGRVEAGETIRKAACREVYEETGITAT